MSQRELLKSVYPTRKWAEKVDKMTDGQVSAIVIKMRNEGKLP